MVVDEEGTGEEEEEETEQEEGKKKACPYLYCRTVFPTISVVWEPSWRRSSQGIGIIRLFCPHTVGLTTGEAK